MKIERTKNATRNILFGVVLKLYQILVPFIMRTVMIYYLGIQYVGLNSLFTSILQVLNLAELGVGGAMVYSMYKPVVNDDKSKICSLMRLYRTYYRLIGTFIGIVGVILAPFVPNLISGDVPSDMNVYILYILNLSATVLSYWLFAYKNCLFEAYQRQDIISKVTIVTNTVQYVLQISAIIIFHNYYLFVIFLLVGQALTNIITAVVANIMFPEYHPGKQLDRKDVSEINGRIRDLFTSKVGAVIINSADTIVISAFLGLTILAEYQNYYYILAAVISFNAIIFKSCTAGIGNSLIVESEEKNLWDLKKITFVISWIAGFSSCCLLNLYQPFMELWVGKQYMFKYSVVICLVLYFYIYEINQLLNMFKDAGGIWHQDRLRPLITALANLLLNLIMVQFWGIYGVVLSTVLTMFFIGMPWIIHNLFSTLFSRENMKGYVSQLLRYTIVSIVINTVTFMLCSIIQTSPKMTIVIRFVACLILPNVMYFIIYKRTEEFKEMIYLVNRLTRHKIIFLNRFIKM